MAIFSSTLMTRAKGSLGNLTIVTTKGRMIAKQKISIMSNPKTEGQVSQRSALSVAVAMWQYCGAVLKSGITAYPEYGSQYSGFVQSNIDFLKGKTINPKNLKNADFVGVQATKGSLGTVNFDKEGLNEEIFEIGFPTGALKNIAKVGDKLVLLVGIESESELGYFEHDLVANDLLSSTASIEVSGDFSAYEGESLVYVAWVQSSDGTKSTTQKFKV